MKHCYFLFLFLLISTFAFSQIPPNDDIHNAPIITSLPYSDINVQTQNATSASGGNMLTCDIGTDYTRVYYEYNPIQNEKIRIELSNGSSSSFILVYETDFPVLNNDSDLSLSSNNACSLSTSRDIVLYGGNYYYFLISNPDGPTDVNITLLNTYPEILNIPDVNFKNALLNTFCVDTNFDSIYDSDVDLNNDNEIQFTEAYQVLNLRVTSQNISDLTGIEYFSNLRALNIGYNSITNLNVTGFNDLESLNCNSNQIGALDLTNNLDLSFLDLASNQLSDIDITNNLDLSYVSLTSNQINDIDVSNNLNLIFLYLNSNLLSNIDVSLNTQLELLAVGYNSISDLDVTSNTLLENLDCSGNDLSSLNLSNNNSLRNLSIFDNDFNQIDLSSNPDLSYLGVSNNNLSEIDVSAQIGLNLFYCSNNYITNLDLTNQVTLDELDCSNNLLESLDLRNGFNYLINDFDASSNSNLTCIYVDDKDAVILDFWQIDVNSNFVNDESECNSLSVREIKDSAISTYPNPVNDVLFIQSIHIIDSIKIYDVNGRQLEAIDIANNRFNSEIKISGYSKGVYFVKIKTEFGMETIEIIKK